MDLKIESYFDEENKSEKSLFTFVNTQLKLSEAAIIYRGKVFKISKKTGNHKELEI